MHYEVNEANEIRVWNDGEDLPFLFQPDYPDGTPWADKADAESWAKLYIASLEDETAPYAPTGPGVPGVPQPTAEERAHFAATMEVRDKVKNGQPITAEEAALLIG